MNKHLIRLAGISLVGLGAYNIGSGDLDWTCFAATFMGILILYFEWEIK